jgi:hypothetical protein
VQFRDLIWPLNEKYALLNSATRNIRQASFSLSFAYSVASFLLRTICCKARMRIAFPSRSAWCSATHHSKIRIMLVACRRVCLSAPLIDEQRPALRNCGISRNYRRQAICGATRILFKVFAVNPNGFPYKYIDRGTVPSAS